MKRFLMTCAASVVMLTSAHAADLGSRPVSKAPPVGIVAYNWSGIYVGGHVGWGWQNADSTLLAAPAPLAFPLGTVTASSSDGVLAGGQIGANWQTGNWVLGVEGDFSWTDASNTVSTASPLIAGLVSNGTTDFNWFATVTGRVGYAWNNWLAYVKGGAAWTEIETSGNATLGGAVVATVNSFNDTRFGWIIGAGVEHGFVGNWSWKLEYNYMDYGSKDYNVSFTPPAGISTSSHDLTAHAVKFGLNYRLGRL